MPSLIRMSYRRLRKSPYGFYSFYDAYGFSFFDSYINHNVFSQMNKALYKYLIKYLTKRISKRINIISWGCQWFRQVYAGYYKQWSDDLIINKK